MSQLLPTRPSLVFLKKQAKDLLAALRSGDATAIAAFSRFFPPAEPMGLVQAQLVLAREYGFESWQALRRHVAALDAPLPEKFIDSAIAGRLGEAKKWWAEHREKLRRDPAAAAIAGDVEAVQAALAAQPELLSGPISPKSRPWLCYVCYSKLAREPQFEAGILAVVDFLLSAGADPNAFFLARGPFDEWRETPLYGAAGVLNHPKMTQMLLDAGADPNDHAVSGGKYRGEALYHSCDFPGKNECLRLILAAQPAQVAKDYCVLRKLDFEDAEGLQLFLDSGVDLHRNDPRTALSHAVLRGRSVAILEMLLVAGADPNRRDLDGSTAYAIARKLGDHEATALLERYGAQANFAPHDAVLIAITEGDMETVEALTLEYPNLLTEMTAFARQPEGGEALGSAGLVFFDLARLGNAKALGALIDLGIDPGLRNKKSETALHWACLAGRVEAANLLIERGAPLDVVETGNHCVPIEWAYWGSINWNEPYGDYAKTVEVLLDAGSPLPATLRGSPTVQAVLRSRGVA